MSQYNLSESAYGVCIGHRFDYDTPIEETVGNSRCLLFDKPLQTTILRCRPFMTLFKLAMFATSGCLPAGPGNVEYLLGLLILSSIAYSLPFLVHIMQSQF
jgi:hypothetical protein